MHQGKLVFAQLNEHLSHAVFAQCVARYAGWWSSGFNSAAAKQTNLKWMDLNGNVTDFSSNQYLVNEPYWGGNLYGGCAYGARYFAAGDFDAWVPNSGAVLAYGGQGYTGYWSACR